MSDPLKTALYKFGVDVLTGAGAAAVTAVLALNLAATDAKTVAFAAVAGAINGGINAARRYLVAATTS